MLEQAIKHLKSEILLKNAEEREAHLRAMFEDLIKEGWEVTSVVPTAQGWLCVCRRGQ